MSEIFVTYKGKEISLEEAEKMGLFPNKKPQPIPSAESLDLSITADDETKSFSFEIFDSSYDLPKDILVEMFGVSSYKSIKKLIEEEGVDYDILVEIGEEMGLL